MTREQRTSWFYFSRLWCTGVQLAFTGQLFNTKHISNLDMLVSKLGGERNVLGNRAVEYLDRQGEFAELRASRALRALCTFVPQRLRALLTCLIYAHCALYLCVLKSFQDGFVVQLLLDIFVNQSWCFFTLHYFLSQTEIN